MQLQDDVRDNARQVNAAGMEDVQHVNIDTTSFAGPQVAAQAEQEVAANVGGVANVIGEDAEAVGNEPPSESFPHGEIAGAALPNAYYTSNDEEHAIEEEDNNELAARITTAQAASNPQEEEPVILAEQDIIFNVGGGARKSIRNLN